MRHWHKIRCPSGSVVTAYKCLYSSAGLDQTLGVSTYVRPHRQSTSPEGLAREVVSRVLDHQANARVAGKVDCGLELRYVGDVYDVDRIAALGELVACPRRPALADACPR